MNWPVLSGADEAAFAQQNLLQTEKLDRDGQIPATGVQQWKKGADVVAAATLTLGDDGNYFDITGTTGIAGIVQLAVGGGSTQAGTIVKLHFDAAVLITHHATDLVLPGGVNITTAAGDELEFTKYESGWRCTNYQHVAEADWTAALTCGTSGTITLKNAYKTGRYRRVGNIITITGHFIVDSVSSPVGTLSLTGFPSGAVGDKFSFAVSIHVDVLEVTAVTAVEAYGAEDVIHINKFAAGVAAVMAADVKADSVFIINATYIGA